MNEVVEDCDLKSLNRKSRSARPRDKIKLSLTCRLPGFRPFRSQPAYTEACSDIRELGLTSTFAAKDYIFMKQQEIESLAAKVDVKPSSRNSEHSSV